MKHAITFSLSSAHTKCRPLRCRVTFRGERCDLRVGVSVDEDKWNDDEERMRINTRTSYNVTSREVNKAIEDVRQEVESIFVRYEAEGKELTSKLLSEEFYKKRNDDVSNDITVQRAFKDFILEQGVNNEWTLATVKKFKTIRSHFRKFDAQMTYKDLTEDKLQRFVNFLHGENLRNTTISKYVEFIHWWLNWSARKGYCSSELKETFKPRLKGADGSQKEIIYLDWKELMMLYRFDFPKNLPALAPVRDVFCFCCFTGLRYSDAYALKVTDIRDDAISIVTQKTSDAITIELNDYSREILDRYKDAHLPNGKALPVLCNQKMNAHLKTIGRLVGINEPVRIIYFLGSERVEKTVKKWQLLTTHCGRRTFVVNALRLGVPPEVIMSWTGHSSFRAMKPYVKIVDALKSEQMSKFNKK
jgi:integrase